MNGTVSRRVFVGSVVAGVPVVVGAGVAAWPFTELQGQAPTSAPQQYGPVVREVQRQLKDAFGKIRDGQSGGARQLATALRIYASTVNDDLLQTSLRKANRQQLLLTDMNHGELVRQAKEFGIDPSRLPPHSLDRVGRQAALDRLIKEGVSPFMRTVADYVDGVAEKMERLERRSGGAMALQVALRQPIPDPVDCGNCEQEQQQVDSALQVATVTCAASAIFPPLAEVCAATSATYLAFYAAYSICLAILAFCRAYYN
jgi:hypothetical protein